MQITTRQALPEDLDNILLLFKETIETINAKDYSYEQIRAWSNGAYKKEKWLVKIKEQFFFPLLISYFSRKRYNQGCSQIWSNQTFGSSLNDNKGG